jgi:PPOX class probable F420-dependent enzyme
MPPTQGELWGLVASHQQAVLATISADGRPQLSNVLYVPDATDRVVRISTTADRIKARNVARDPRSALHVSGDDFWHYAVAEGPITLSAVAASPGDAACLELQSLHRAFYAGSSDPDAFYREMIAAGRLVLRLHVRHLYGVIAPGARRPAPPSADSASKS